MNTGVERQVGAAGLEEKTRPQARVFAVVVVYNDLEDARRCLVSLLGASPPVTEIVVVDNASPDGSAEKLPAEFPGVTMIRMPANIGYAGGNNAGIRYALARNADFVLVVNSDIIVSPGFLGPMLGAAARHPGAGVVTCKIVYEHAPDRIYYAAGTFSPLLCSGADRRRLPGWRSRTGRECAVDFASGAFLLVRSSVFGAVGLMDEKFFMYFEDLEFSRRVSRSYSMVYTPLSVVSHKSGAGTDWASLSELYLYYHTRNRFLAFRGDPPAYRFYVLCFAFAAACAKSIVIILGRRPHGGSPAGRRLAALWRGLGHGVRIWLRGDDEQG